ncbi:hypothetical protein PG993_013212 [Apiospora rasikravindrae]|uniref:Rhodopsin domain-containing protein n=1 Tax=Apiospora rasikravindrae TaxID=990691 RepID=A0ABR1RYE7_9PEZI
MDTTPRNPNGGYESIPIQNAGQIWMIVTCVFTMFIPSALVAMRFVARSRFSNAPLDASDWCIALALVFVLALCIVDFFMVFRGGFTFDLKDIAVRFGPDALDTFFRCMAAWPLLWNCCVLTSKLSVLAMYQTLMPIPRMRLAVRVVGGFVILYNVCGFITGLVICQPYEKNYDWQGVVKGKCGDVKTYYEWLSAINVISDVIVLLLPLPFVYNLQLQLRKKIVLFLMFSVGFITCAVTIYRQTLLPSLDATNPTGTGLLAFLFSTVEIGVAVSLACVPFLRPLFRGTFGSSSNRSHPTPESAYSYSKKGSSKPRSQGFNELGDGGSEIQLSPVVVVGNGNAGPAQSPTAVNVETSWIVERHSDDPEGGRFPRRQTGVRFNLPGARAFVIF